MDIADVSKETRKRLYDLMDPDRTIANGVWNGAPLSEFETFIAKALGYLVDKPKAEKIEAKLIYCEFCERKVTTPHRVHPRPVV